MRGLDGVAGGVTVVTGYEKGSGKTTFLNLALPYARSAGPVAVFSIGVDGAQKARGGHAPSPEVRVEPGDLVLTTEPFARLAGARLEVLESLPGRAALGRLMLGRAVRGGSVTLVGCEHFSLLAELLAQVRAEGWAASALVDGAVNRITQVGALGELRFAFTARVNRANLSRSAARMRALASLAELPEEVDPEAGILRLEGPLTREGLKELPEELPALSLEDFTKVFLEPEELARLLGRCRVTVRRRFELLCLAVTLRDVSRDAFLRELGPEAAGRVLFNPHEVAA